MAALSSNDHFPSRSPQSRPRRCLVRTLRRLGSSSRPALSLVHLVPLLNIFSSSATVAFTDPTQQGAWIECQALRTRRHGGQWERSILSRRSASVGSSSPVSFCTHVGDRHRRCGNIGFALNIIHTLGGRGIHGWLSDTACPGASRRRWLPLILGAATTSP